MLSIQSVRYQFLVFSMLMFTNQRSCSWGGNNRGNGDGWRTSSLKAWPTYKNTTSNCWVCLGRVVLCNIWTSQDSGCEWNVYKDFISGDCECRTGPSRADEGDSSHLPFVNKRLREGKESKQTTTQAFPLCWTHSWSSEGAAFNLETYPSLLKQHFLNCYTKLNYPFKPRVLTQVYSLCYWSEAAGEFLDKQALFCARSQRSSL